MNETLKNSASGESRVSELADMPSYEEHMAEIGNKEKQAEIKDIIATGGLEDILSDYGRERGSWKNIDYCNKKNTKEAQNEYDIRKREIIEKVFTGSGVSEIEELDDNSSEKNALIKESLEDMIEFGTFTLFNEEEDTIKVIIKNIFGRYLGEECPYLEIENDGILDDNMKRRVNVNSFSKPLARWDKYDKIYRKSWGCSESDQSWENSSPEKLADLFDKYDIDVNNEKIREKALNGFARTLTKRQDFWKDNPLYTSVDGTWVVKPGETDTDGFCWLEGPISEQAKWYYDTFKLGKLKSDLGEDEINKLVEKYREQSSGSTIQAAKSYEELPVNGFDLGLKQFMEHNHIEGDAFNQ